MRFLTPVLILVLLWLPALALPAPGAAQAPLRWQGPDGQPLPFASDREAEEFLRSACAVSKEELLGGTTRPLKLLLEKDGVTAHAVFRTVDIKRPRAKIYGKFYLGFHDSHVYECAAYRLSRMLGIDNVPPCVRRRFELDNGTMQLWIEGARTEGSRLAAGDEPPVPLDWLIQKQTMRLFDALIYNYDRNLGNMLIDGDWKLWFIDHTRSFLSSAQIESLGRIVWCEREVWEKLQALERKAVGRELGPYLNGTQIGALFKRRDKLVAHLEARIAELGEGAILFGGQAEGLSDVEVAAAADNFPEKSAHPDTGQPDG